MIHDLRFVRTDEHQNGSLTLDDAVKVVNLVAPDTVYTVTREAISWQSRVPGGETASTSLQATGFSATPLTAVVLVMADPDGWLRADLQAVADLFDIEDAPAAVVEMGRTGLIGTPVDQLLKHYPRFEDVTNLQLGDRGLQVRARLWENLAFSMAR